jgi:hypothetical protein
MYREPDDDFRRISIGDEAGSYVTCISIEQWDDGYMVIGFDAKLIGLWNEWRLEQIDNTTPSVKVFWPSHEIIVAMKE